MSVARSLVTAAFFCALLPNVARAQEAPTASGAEPVVAPAPLAPPAPPARDEKAPVDTPVDPMDRPGEHRSGVVFGVALGIGTLDVSGYPNSASALGDPRKYHSSGAILGGGQRIFLMGALADTFNFGVWVGGLTGENATTKVATTTGGFRVEAFPLYHVSPKLRDLGLVAQLGVGHAVADKKDGSLSVDGTESMLGAGVLYELARPRFIGLRVTPGLFAEYQYVSSASIDSHGVIVGARIAFYGGP